MMLSRIVTKISLMDISLKDMYEDAEKSLHPDLKHSKLLGSIKLYNVKGNYGLLDKRILTLLEILTNMLSNEKICQLQCTSPKNQWKYWVNYEKVWTCWNDCILYKNGLTNVTENRRCGASSGKQ